MKLRTEHSAPPRIKLLTLKLEPMKANPAVDIVEPKRPKLRIDKELPKPTES
jgi:hypothetical protein